MSIRLSFGTAGIRAPLGPGPDQLNVDTVAGVAHAVCGHLLEAFPDARARGLCVAFDGRHQSTRFALEFVAVARAYGLLVRVFERPMPTPVLAFCTRFHGAIAGVMITASHNPPSDNGIKLYMAGGAQVLAPHDQAIAQRIASYDPRATVAPTDSPGALLTLGEPELQAYLDTVAALMPASATPLPRFAYSALYGVGAEVTRRLFARVGAHDVVEVASQNEPQADLGGLAQPNPEHADALTDTLQLAAREQLGLAFVHDPDADRLAVVARDRTGSLRALSGDEVGALLGDFLLAQSTEPARALLVSTLVSGELLERICRARGAQFTRTPTGFKWIASRARALERERGLEFLFGYEEAIGYAFGRIADDKDGIAALSVLLELARRLHAEGKTISDRLDELAQEHGLFATRQITVPRDEALMKRLRALDPETILGAGSTRTDYEREPEAIDLLVFQRPDGTRLCVRPSGTEPKVKLYLHVSIAVSGRLPEAEAHAQSSLDALERQARNAISASTLTSP